jgi:hypothetical protein
MDDRLASRALQDELHTQNIDLLLREVSSFYLAVRMTYGEEQADQAAMDWIGIMEEIPQGSEETRRYARRITIRAAAHLAKKVCDGASISFRLGS